MIKNSQQILRDCKYDVICNRDDNKVTINLPWENKPYELIWSSGNITNNLTNHTIKCPQYAFPSVASLVLTSLTKSRQYPNHWITYLNKNKSAKSFPINKNTNENNMFILAEDIIKNGILPAHVELAKESKIEEGLNVILSNLYGLKINE